MSHTPQCPLPTRLQQHNQSSTSLHNDLLALGRRLGLGDATANLLSEARTIHLDLPNRARVYLRAAAGDQSPLLQRIVDRGIDFEPYALGRLPMLSGTALDIGSHYGTTAIALALLQPRLIVHAFEPNPRTFLYLCWNIAANNVADRVMPRNLGLSRDGEPIELLHKPSDSISARARHMGKQGIGGLSSTTTSRRRDRLDVHLVPTARLHTFLHACGIARAAFLKLDCEGCGARASLDMRTSG